MGIKNNELRLGQNDTPLEDPREGEVSLRIDSTGAIFTKAEGAVSETGVVTSASAPLKYTANNSLYGKNNTPDSDAGTHSAVQIGYNAAAYGENTIAIGEGAKGYNAVNLPYSGGYSSIAIGRNALANKGGVSIGSTTASRGDSVAIGAGAKVGDGTTVMSGVAIGRGMRVPAAYSKGIAIGMSGSTVQDYEVLFQISSTKNMRFFQWTPVAETPAATHTWEVMISNVRYKILLAAV